MNTAVQHERSWLFKYVQFKTALGKGKDLDLYHIQQHDIQ